MRYASRLSKVMCGHRRARRKRSDTVAAEAAASLALPVGLTAPTMDTGQPDSPRTGPHGVKDGETAAGEDTQAAARRARGRGVVIDAASSGCPADEAPMQESAADGVSSTLRAEGDIETDRAQLRALFRRQGGKRPLALID